MDSWLKKFDDNGNKPITDDVEAAIEADATLTCTSKNFKFNEKNKASHTKKRTYNESFLQYGFTFISENDEHRPLCLICNKVLASESLKPAKLKRHLHTKHDSHRNKPVEFFHRLLRTAERQRQSFESEFVNEGKYIRASFEASLLIAKCKKPYNIGEELILPAAIKMSAIVYGKKEANKMQKISLSNNTVARRISEISKDQREQLIVRIKKSRKFAIHLDESTDITNKAYLLSYVRYIYNNDILEDLLFCQPFHGRTTGMDIFQMVDNFFQEVGLFWTDCVGVCTDGAAAMTRHTAGFHARVRSASDTSITFTHCMIHREALVAKKISPNLNAVVQNAVQIINFIKSRALNTRIFANLCGEMESEFKTLLLHCEVRWLSKAKALKRLLMLKNEVVIFLMEKNSDLVHHLRNESWLLKLCYLSDLLEKLNELNLSLQGENTNIFTLKSKIEAFIKKLNIWKQKVENGSFEMFSFTEEFLTNNDVESNVIKPLVIEHLSNLLKQFQNYFLPELDNTNLDWIQNPFAMKKQSTKYLSLKFQEELADLSSDSKLQLEFSKKKLHTFWLTVRAEYPLLSDLAVSTLLPFVSTYLCESAFSTLTAIKTKYRSSLSNIETALRPALTNIEPRLDLLCSRKQSHPSH